MTRNTAAIVCRPLLAAGACLAFAIGVNAQVNTTTSETEGEATHKVQVEHGTVASVNGNHLFVRMEDGSLRDIPNVPEAARAFVDGKELSVHELKPGMKLEHTITTTSTPKTVTTVQTVTGKVFHIQPPSRVILRLEDGTNQSFNIPKGQKFNIDGQMVDAWGLKKGMNVSATKVVETPVNVVTQNRRVTGSAPPPPDPPADAPILVATTQPPAPAAAAPPTEVAAQELPKTASPLPLTGLLGLLCIGLSLAMRKLDRF
jgi:hypothetical protein